MSGNLNPFEEEEVNPRHQKNLQMTVGKVGKVPLSLCNLQLDNRMRIMESSFVCQVCVQMTNRYAFVASSYPSVQLKVKVTPQ